MARSLPLVLALVAAVVLMGVAAYYQSWGALALLLVTAVGWGWYRVQVARTEAAEKFFSDDLGEETRVTNFAGGAPSEMPVDPPPPPPRP